MATEVLIGLFEERHELRTKGKSQVLKKTKRFSGETPIESLGSFGGANMLLKNLSYSVLAFLFFSVAGSAPAHSQTANGQCRAKGACQKGETPDKKVNCFYADHEFCKKGSASKMCRCNCRGVDTKKSDNKLVDISPPIVMKEDSGTTCTGECHKKFHGNGYDQVTSYGADCSEEG